MDKNRKMKPSKEKVTILINKTFIAFGILLEITAIKLIKLEIKLLEIIMPKNSKQKTVLNNIKAK